MGVGADPAGSQATAVFPLPVPITWQSGHEPAGPDRTVVSPRPDIELSLLTHSRPVAPVEKFRTNPEP